ncbi:hypothetical protein ON010_g524 [Phytophthora cinnamomi]|nr:hypothetical protein ON010_g524 [Phytophthora cinnamomi]
MSPNCRCDVSECLVGSEQAAAPPAALLRGALAGADARDERVSRPHELDDLAVLGRATAAEEAAAPLLELHDAVVAADGLALVAAVEQVAHCRWNWVGCWCWLAVQRALSLVAHVEVRPPGAAVAGGPVGGASSFCRTADWRRPAFGWCRLSGGGGARHFTARLSYISRVDLLDQKCRQQNAIAIPCLDGHFGSTVPTGWVGQDIPYLQSQCPTVPRNCVPQLDGGPDKKRSFCSLGSGARSPILRAKASPP